MYLLDIGGGFPGSEDVKLKFEEVIYNQNLHSYFSKFHFGVFQNLCVLSNTKRNYTNIRMFWCDIFSEFCAV